MAYPIAKRSLSALVFVVFLSMTQGLAQAQLPAMGDGAEMTAGAERQLGDRIVRELYRDPDYLEDAVLIEYVQGVWQPLLAAARVRGELPAELDERFAWDILLGRDRTVNAFALPGGYLGLHLGLIGVVTSRDELASVLAHELSHVTQRHISRLMARQSRQSPWLLGAMVLGALAASKSPEAANAVMIGSQALAAQNQLSFSRDMEREADRVGYGVVVQAGFESRGFVTMFEKLQQASRLNDNGSFPYLRSHPLTTERIADMQARQGLVALAQVGSPDVGDLVHAMVAARARVLSNLGVDVLRAWVTEPDAGGFAALSASRRAAVLYAGALASKSLRDFARAGVLARQLGMLVAGDVAGTRQARLLAAEIALAAGDMSGAARWLEVPAAGEITRTGRPELLMRAAFLTQNDQSAQAADLLRNWLAEHPRDAAAWQTLAAAYAAQGQPLHAIRAEGEVQMAYLDYAGAVDRFKAARALSEKGRNPPEGHIEASIIDTRLRQAESLLREQALER